MFDLDLAQLLLLAKEKKKERTMKSKPEAAQPLRYRELGTYLF
jgi:hypothetical protein